MSKILPIMHAKQIVDNEQGVAIITALLVLLLLSIIAITATKTTTTEKNMVRSEAVFERDFYLAESAAMEGLQKIENESAPKELLAPLIVLAGAGQSNNAGLLVSPDPDNPDDEQENLDTNDDGVVDETDYDASELATETHRLVVQLPISSGSSLALGSSRLYSYMSYGVTNFEGGRAMIKVGYKKRF